MVFNHVFKKEWFEDELVKKIIHDIDGIYKTDGTCLWSKGIRLSFGTFAGAISPQELSLSSKMLILMLKLNEPKLVFYSEFIDSKYYKYVFEIAKIKDISLSVFNKIPYEDGYVSYIYDTDRTINTKKEFSDEFFTAVERYYSKHFQENYNHICQKHRITVLTGCDIIDQKLIISKLTNKLLVPYKIEISDIIGKNVKVSGIVHMTDDFLSHEYNIIEYLRKNGTLESFKYVYTDTLFLIDDFCTLTKHEDFSIFYKNAVAENNYFLFITSKLSTISNIRCNINSVLKLKTHLINVKSEIHIES